MFADSLKDAFFNLQHVQIFVTVSLILDQLNCILFKDD